MSRAERRTSKKYGKEFRLPEVVSEKDINFDSSLVYSPTAEVGSLGHDLQSLEIIQKRATLIYGIGEIQTKIGVSDHLIWKGYLSGYDSAKQKELNREMQGDIGFINIQKLAFYAPVFRSKFYALSRLPTYKDQDELDLLNDLKESGLSFLDVFGECMRVRSELMDLVKMQIEWLNQSDAALKEPKPMEVIEPTISDATAREISENPKLVGSKKLFVTRVPYSIDPSDLSEIDLTDATSAMKDIEVQTRGSRSIKPSSILSAVDFYANLTDIQRSLLAKNKFEPEDRKKWFKMKRGKDRLRLFTNEDQVILFIAGRDVAYRNL